MKITVRRTIAAFVLAPLAVPVVFVTLSLVIPDSERSSTNVAVIGIWDRLSGLAVWTLIVALYSLPIAYVFELVVGLPVWIIFRHFNIRSIGIFALGGAVIGWLVDLCLSVWSGRTMVKALNPLSSAWLSYDLLFVVSAVVAAVLFWAIVFPPCFTSVEAEVRAGRATIITAVSPPQSPEASFAPSLQARRAPEKRCRSALALFQNIPELGEIVSHQRASVRSG